MKKILGTATAAVLLALGLQVAPAAAVPKDRGPGGPGCHVISVSTREDVVWTGPVRTWRTWTITYERCHGIIFRFIEVSEWHWDFPPA